MYSGFTTIKECLDAHKLWDEASEGGKRADLIDADLKGASLKGAYLRGADLTGASLKGADLRYANLRYADLIGADLTGVDLIGANLSDANFTGADLSDANLSDANFTGVDLRGVDLRGANLSGAYLPDGHKWEVYLARMVPALCTAGGVALETVAAAWDCHSWENCPMAVAFGVHSIAEVPPLYRHEAEIFVHLFDYNLIPKPTDLDIP